MLATIYMNITPKYNNKAFNRFLLQEIDLDSYRFKYLKDYLDKVISGQLPVYDLSIVNIADNGWILILHGEMLLVYGDNWTKNQLIEIREVFELNKFTNFTLAGDNDLIDELINFYKPNNFIVEKRRLFYKANDINNFISDNMKILNGNLNQLNELAKMLQDYYHEEYNGLNDKTYEEMQKRIYSVIQSGKIYVLLDNKENIVSFCTIIDPDIGIMFTKREHRNNGYAKIILSYCSRILQQKNETVYVMTDRDKLESNIVCEAVGFKPFYSYLMTKINCG
jgi:hypothetical protein